MNKRYETYETRLETGGLADDLEIGDSPLGALGGQIDGLRQIAFGCLLLSAIVLAFLIYHGRSHGHGSRYRRRAGPGCQRLRQL